MKKLLVVVLPCLLVACGKYSSNGESLYLQSVNGAVVEVPPPLTRANVSDYYNLPAQTQDAKVSIAPPVEELET